MNYLSKYIFYKILNSAQYTHYNHGYTIIHHQG